MIKLNQIKIGTIVYDWDGHPLRVVVINPKNTWWKVICETIQFGGWLPSQKMINEYGLSIGKRYWGYSLEELCLNRCHTYEVE